MRLSLILPVMVLSSTAVLLPVSAQAVLGGHRDRVESEKTSLRGSGNVVVTEGTSFTMLSLQTVTGSINQYANKEGQIFAVTWRGLHPPDLSLLLGEHFGDYQKSKDRQVHEGGRRPGAIQTGRITVKHFGHMRDIRGVAYQSSMVPAGIDAETLP